MPEINLIDCFTYYKGEPHQKEAIQLLQSAMPDSLLKSKCAWVTKWRETPEAPPLRCHHSASTSLLSLRALGHHLICAQQVCQPLAMAARFIQTANRLSYPTPRHATKGQGNAGRALPMVEKDFWNVLKNTIPYWEEMNDNQQISAHQLRIQPWRALLFFRRV